MMRTILTVITVFFMTVLCGISAILVGIVHSYSPLIRFFGVTWSRSILFSAGVKLEVHGLENITENESYVFISNHQSHFDVISVFSVLPGTIRFMAKRELFKIPVFGWAMAAVGMVKIDRSNRQQSIQSMNNALNIVKNRVSVVVFPEGTRSSDGLIRPFKKGGFVLAIKGGIPIIPVSISGSRFILKKHSMRLQPGRIKVVFSEPIATKAYNYQDRQKLMDKTREIITGNFDKHFNETAA